MTKQRNSSAKRVSRKDTDRGPDEGRPLRSGLHLVATPIGHLGDLSTRALDTLKLADLVLCEDSRVTGKLLKLHGVERSLLAYHEHNAARMRPRVLDHLARGETVALASDAGTPLVSDPGYKLVREVIEAGHEVLAVPGPSAALAALVVSGLPTDRFLFAGFLPSRSSARRRAIEELAGVPATLIWFESAKRVAGALDDLAEILGPRPAAVARELTKAFEEVRRGPLGELAAAYGEIVPPRGEIVIVVGPPGGADGCSSDETLEEALREALSTMGPSAAAASVAKRTGRPRQDLYRRALALRADET
ncbi:MAG: 16S rRNA (cytidine(1402)-2'-O)-methyltransferase [Geminicoccaceae bacterium]